MVLLIKQILEFLLYAGQAVSVAPIVNKTLLVSAFEDVYNRVVGFGSRHEAEVLGWSRIGRVLVPPDPGPGCQVLVKGFGLASPSFASSTRNKSAWPNSCCGNLASP